MTIGISIIHLVGAEALRNGNWAAWECFALAATVELYQSFRKKKKRNRKRP